ncbi:MAG: hypothetical protein LBM67_07015 [Lentimicrobiaceae bacterium]|jgi:2-iminobutanoate/2-iminopropanoate deaminase|nr:hypothetical protein [Lentimicrobiaceae bacterium]
MKKIIATSKAPQASNAYSQAVQAGNMLFVSGQLPIDMANGEIPETFLEQVHQALKNLQTIIEEAQFSMSDVVKTTVFLSDFYGFELREDYDRVYKPLLGEYQDPVGDYEEYDEDGFLNDEEYSDDEEEFDEDFFDEDECFIDYFTVFNTIYSQYFPENPPARSCVAVKQLPKWAMIEIEAIAVK